jgi:hypothetical protein
VYVLLAVCAVFSPRAGGAQQPQADDGAFQVEVGKSVIVSPVVTELRCDDGIIEAVPSAEGMAFKGLRPGKTLCSFYNGARIRVLVAVRVLPEAPRPPASPPATR